MLISINNMDLKQICNSGQCFRWNEITDNEYELIAFDRYLKIKQNGNVFDFSCSIDEWNLIWSDYLDYNTDYEKIGNIIIESKDKYLTDAYNNGKGIRILKQDLWEVIVSFIISQNNNIKRIRNSIEAICSKAGYYVYDECGNKIDRKYRFPKADELDEQFFDDTSLGLGYRNEYLKVIFDYARNNKDWLIKLRGMSNEEAMAELKSHYGIGDKVANCICLFGLHQVNSFPIDTHIKQILNNNYPNGFDYKRYSGFEGIVQQYMFYYKINQ